MSYCARQSLEEGEGSRKDSGQSETFYSGPQVKVLTGKDGRPPEPSVARSRGDPGCEAYTGGVQAV